MRTDIKVTVFAACSIFISGCYSVTEVRRYETSEPYDNGGYYSQSYQKERHLRRAYSEKESPVFKITATVIGVDPIVETYSEYREYRNNHAGNALLGMAIGGAAGYTIGSELGGATSKAVGALAGASMGSVAVDANTGIRREYISRETVVVGYEAEVEYRGKIFKKRLNYFPRIGQKIDIYLTM